MLHVKIYLDPYRFPGIPLVKFIIDKSKEEFKDYLRKRYTELMLIDDGKIFGGEDQFGIIIKQDEGAVFIGIEDKTSSEQMNTLDEICEFINKHFGVLGILRCAGYA